MTGIAQAASTRSQQGLNTLATSPGSAINMRSGSSTRPIALRSRAHAMFTSDKVAAGNPAANDPQPAIADFSPSSGAAGAVITVSGSGFTGINSAWIGSGHDATVSVISDSEVHVTVPADASTGQIALLNPSHAAFSATPFSMGSGTPQPGGNGSSESAGRPTRSISATLQSSGNYSPVNSGSASASSAASSPGILSAAPGGLSIHVVGNHFVDGAGKTLQLRGVNFSGFENVAVQGWNPSDPTGGQGGQPDGPKWSAVRNWHANVVRIPLNEASWLGYRCTDTNGEAHDPDPGRNYKSAVATQVARANAAGLFVILDLHWTAPGSACPMLQTQMADADHSLAFWTDVAKQFKGNPAVMFELFNEPFFNFDFSGNAWSCMMNGTGGSFSGFPATSRSGNWQNVQQPWAAAGYQQMIDAVRSTGASNVVLVGSMQYAQDLSEWLANKPTDPHGQLAAAWHAYPTFGTTWGTPAYAQPNFSPQIRSEVQGLLAAGIPVVATETGDQNTAGTAGAPLVSNITAFADQTGIGLIGWAWDVWEYPNHVLIKDVNGTPTDGYGQVFHNWMVNHAP